MTDQTVRDGVGLNPEDEFFEVFESYRPAPPPATDEVVAVLRPFAEAADSYDDEREEWPLFEVHDIIVSHLRAARSLLAKLEVRG